MEQFWAAAVLNENKTAGPLTVVVDAPGTTGAPIRRMTLVFSSPPGRRAETIGNFQAALKNHLKIMQEDGLPTPNVTELEIREVMAV